MIQTNLSNLLDQSKDLLMVNEDFQLIYANPTFLNFMTSFRRRKETK
jgi:hypothetical protein